MRMAGVHRNGDGARLRHASIGITLGTYSEVLPGIEAAAAAQLDAVVDDAHESNADAV
jgi:hypothetical protein